ncbi:PssE/Cps14G family polysaccharide biosynthesis glycosyltransferase [Clostridium sp.]|uniref:PssE/Cps14G family polysaccharide biosynthesis glycosyltransferase n=1 Tax=Clostridium sp. TaxID=1506 RepID=UPI00261052D3|nr:PssE/Cps14G family polysaccharide biosynthesis glycosyltransferase [Clostridium sp.]
MLKWLDKDKGFKFNEKYIENKVGFLVRKESNTLRKGTIVIFITVGTQKFQFNRLLKEVDKLIEEKKITEEVFAQIGYCDYKPKNYSYKNFIDRDEYENTIKKCQKVITHGGTGAIVGAVKQGKKVIAIPRLKEFGEHVDDHQIQIVSEFKKIGFIVGIESADMLGKAIDDINKIDLKEYISNTHNIIAEIEKFIEKLKIKGLKSKDIFK